MKNIERNRTWKIREKMVTLFRMVGSLRAEMKNRGDHHHNGEKPIRINHYRYANSTQTLATIVR